VTTAQLRALLALADAGSYVSAALQTGLSQPAVHRPVRDIERLAGAPLVERRGRGVALTEAGGRVARGLRLA
jgi:DNA-binding transcriptional LysR family regulator